MKKLILITVAFIGFHTIALAQEHNRGNRVAGEKANKMMTLSAEEMATLQTKKMTLHLGLNESQQAEVKKINLENATKRKAMMAARNSQKESDELVKPTKEERLKMANMKLDHQIAMKAKMKAILNDEQFAKWEKAQARKEMKGKKKPVGNKRKQKNNE